MKHKARIRDRAISGLDVDPAEVARVSRSKRYLTMRHAWQNEDGRASDGVFTAARRLARSVARRTGKSVEIYHRDGSLLAVVEPEKSE